jgi:hypothetical protein
MNRHRGLRRAAVAATVLTLAACGAASLPAGNSATGGSTGALSIQVVADMFSGRENPQWELTDPQLQSFSRCFAGASPAPSSPAVDEGRLGFRGFIMRRLPSSIPFVELRVLPTLAVGTDAQGAKVALSGCEPLFAMLRQSASKHLSQAELAGIPEGGQ